MKKLAYLIVVLLIVSSCSSPENEGKELAQWMNDCAETFIKDKQKAETDFVNHFDASDYSSRTEALEAYDQAMIEVLDEYNSCHDEVVVKRSKIFGEYANDYKKLSAFETAYGSNIDSELNDRLMDAIAETDYPAAVLAKVKTVIPPKPNYQQISQDLVGHRLTEGVENGYYSPDWKWIIEDGEISDFEIISVLADTPNEYVIIATMKLTSMIGKAFNTKVKIRYILPTYDDWKIEYITSLGMSVVKTGIYNDLINVKRDNCNDGFFVYTRRYCYFIENKGDIPLEIGYKKYDGTWSKESTVIKAYDTYQIECDDFRIDYVELP